MRSDIARIVQAWVLYDLGFANEGKSFEEYLEDIPQQVPENPNLDLFDRLVLVERRLGITQSCQLLDVSCRHDDKSLINFYDPREYPPVEWVWMQDGRRNRGRRASNCRETCEKGELSLTAIEGLMLYAQNRTVLDKPDSHVMNLPGSIVANRRDDILYLIRWQSGQVELHRYTEGYSANPDGSSGSRAG